MARRRQADGEQYNEADNGFSWSRKRASATSVERGSYVTTLFGIKYELEKRRRSPGDTPDTGWYLYSFGVSGGFFGEYCDATLLPAIDKASELIAKADLRGEGYERKETP
jgi:hypothetical protein